MALSLPTLVASAVAVLVAVVGARATELGPWYRELRKPEWQPPDWLFGPAWTTIYICCVWSVSVAWPAATSPARRAYLAAWAVNLLANAWWSVLFFRQQRPDWALREVALLWGSIAVLVVLSWRMAPRAGTLLLPYLLWVSFAAVLNATIVRLNAPFSGT